MNNATMYKSKGWETLPSTYQEQYSFTTANIINTTDSVIKIVADQKGNTIVLNQKTIACFSSAGTVLWYKEISSLGGNSYNNKTLNDCIVVDGNVWVCSDGYIYILKDGNVVTTIKGEDVVTRWVVYGSFYLYIASLTLHNNKVYVGYASNYIDGGTIVAAHIGYSVMNIDGTYTKNSTILLTTNLNVGECKNVIDGLDSPSYVYQYIRDLCWDKDGKLYFIYGRYKIIQYNLSSKTIMYVNYPLSIPQAADLSAHIAMDSLGYLYLAAYNMVWKFNLDVTKPVLWQKVLQEPIDNNISYITTLYARDIKLDSQDNCYVETLVLNTNYSRTFYYLYKLSSDGTDIWKRYTETRVLNTVQNSCMYIDSQDTIYDCRYGLSGSQLTPVITKMINLVKTT